MPRKCARRSSSHSSEPRPCTQHPEGHQAASFQIRRGWGAYSQKSHHWLSGKFTPFCRRRIRENQRKWPQGSTTGAAASVVSTSPPAPDAFQLIDELRNRPAGRQQVMLISRNRRVRVVSSGVSSIATGIMNAVPRSMSRSRSSAYRHSRRKSPRSAPRFHATAPARRASIARYCFGSSDRRCPRRQFDQSRTKQ
jgi:hypothetical protein